MESEILSPTKDLNTIKLIRGQRGTYGFEIKLVGEDVDAIVKKLKLVNDELVNTYSNLNDDGGKQ